MIKLQDIIDFFKPKVNLTKTDSKTINKALPKINYKILNPARHYLLDERYKTTSIEEFKLFLERDMSNIRLFIRDYYDCDNFAFKLRDSIKQRFPSFAIGIVIGLNHAYNVFIDKNGKAWFIEPQSDKIFSYTKLPTKYKPIELIIL